MGYYVTIELENVVIPASKTEECLKAINDLFFAKKMKNKASGGSNREARYAWVNNPPKGGFPFLVDAFEEWRYDAHENKNGDVQIDYFAAEKWGNDEILYETIAPFLSKNAKIYCTGSNNEHWKYTFKNGKMKSSSGRIVYDDE